MSIWNHLEHWLPAPGQTEPARKFHAMDEGGIEIKVKAYYTPCHRCAIRADNGEAHDQSLMILCNGVGHLMVAANRPLCEEPPPRCLQDLAK